MGVMCLARAQLFLSDHPCFFLSDANHLNPGSWLSSCPLESDCVSWLSPLRVESCSTENLELRKKVEVLENTNR